MRYFRCLRTKRAVQSFDLAPGWFRYARVGAEWVQRWLAERTHGRCPICSVLFVCEDEESYRERIWRHIEVDHGRKTFYPGEGE